MRPASGAATHESPRPWNKNEASINVTANSTTRFTHTAAPDDERTPPTSHRSITLLVCADAYGGLDGEHKDFPVTDLASMRGLGDDFDGGFDLRVREDDL